MKRLGKAPLERHGELLATQEPGIAHRVAHLPVVLERHLRDRLGVGAPRRLVPGEQLAEVGAVGEQRIEHRAVLEGGVHPLAVKRHDRVRRVPEQQHPAERVPGDGVHGPELTLRVREEFRDQVRHVRHGVGELPGEELPCRRGARERGEALARKEQRRREARVGIGQGDQHEAAARPDVQRVALERRDAAGGGHGELLVVVVEPLLAHLGELLRGERGAQRRARPVGTDRDPERHLVHRAVRIAQAQALLREAGTDALLIEMHTHVRVCERGRDQHAVEIGAPHRPDDLVRALPVGLQRGGAGELVHHAAAHGDEERAHLGHEARVLERADAARGEREVDRAAALGAALARVAAPLVERHLQAAPRQQQGEQRPRKPRADDIDVSAAQPLHGRSTSPSSCANCQASSKRL